MTMTNATPEIITLSGKPDAQEEFGVGDSLWTIALRRLRRDHLTMIALAVLLFLIVVSFSAPLLASAIHIDPDRTVQNEEFLNPLERGHFLGTDDLGRDFFIR